MAHESDLDIASQRLLGTPEVEQPKEETVDVVEESPVEETLEAGVEESTDDMELDNEDSEQPEEVGDDSADEVEEEATEDDDDTYYTVKVDGEEFEVNLEELQKGYQLEKNYTKKAQQLAEERKVMQEFRQALEAEKAQYMQLTQMAALQQQAGIQAAKEKLQTIDKNVDPIGFVQAQLEVQELEQGLAAQAQQYQQVQMQQVEAQAQQRAELQAQAAQELADMVDGWADEQKRREIQEGVVSFAESMGYTKDELNNIVSARDIVVLNKARLYDELVANKASVKGKRKPKIKKKVSSPTPTTGKTRKARAVKEKRGQLKRSGSVSDAAALILEGMQKN